MFQVIGHLHDGQRAVLELVWPTAAASGAATRRTSCSLDTPETPIAPTVRPSATSGCRAEHDEAIGLDDAVEQRGFRLDQAPPVLDLWAGRPERGDPVGLVLGDLGAQERGAVHPGQREQRARPTGTPENPQVVKPGAVIAGRARFC